MKKTLQCICFSFFLYFIGPVVLGKDHDATYQNIAPQCDGIGNEEAGSGEKVLSQGLKEERERLKEIKEKMIEGKQLLLALQEDVTSKLDKIKARQEKLEKLQAMYARERDTNIKRLVLVYENMPAKEAAKVFESMSLERLVFIVRKMKAKPMANIMSELSLQKAQRITNTLVERFEDGR